MRRRRDRQLAMGVQIVAFVLGAMIGPSRAEAQQARGWEFEVTPYLWAAGLSGDIGVRGAPPASVDLSFSDLLENLDFGGMLALEAGTGPWRFLLDGMYIKLSADGDTPGPFFSGVDAEQEIGLVQAALGYRLVSQERVTLDALAGARAWIIDAELDFKAGVLPGRTFDGDKAWVDPIIGVRGRFGLTRTLSLTILGDIGGFGVASHFTWQAWGGLVWQFAQHWSVKVGYRALGVDYDDDGFVYDTVLQGPVIGVGFRF